MPWVWSSGATSSISRILRPSRPTFCKPLGPEFLPSLMQRPKAPADDLALLSAQARQAAGRAASGHVRLGVRTVLTASAERRPRRRRTPSRRHRGGVPARGERWE